MESSIWDVEESLWTAGRFAYATHMAPDCLMVLAQQPLLLSATEVLDAIDIAPRWRSVEMTGRHANETGLSIVLGYHALAFQDGRNCEALCTSVYRRDGGIWKLIHQHQTAV